MVGTLSGPDVAFIRPDVPDSPGLGVNGYGRERSPGAAVTDIFRVTPFAGLSVPARHPGLDFQPAHKDVTGSRVEFGLRPDRPGLVVSEDVFRAGPASVSFPHPVINHGRTTFLKDTKEDVR